MNETVEYWMRRIVGFVDGVSDWIGGWIIAFLAIPLLYVVCFEVISRYVFNAPTDWAFELTFMLYGAFFMLGAGYTLLKGGHVRTDIFYNNWSFRTRGTLDTTLYILAFFPGMIFFFFVGWEEMLHAYNTAERSDVTPWGPSIVPFKATIPAAAALLLFQGVSELCKSIYAMVENKPLLEDADLIGSEV